MGVPDLFPGVDLAAQAMIRSYCGWHIAPVVTETIRVDGSGTSVQMLPTLRLASLTSISNDGVEIPSPEWSESGMVRLPGGWRFGANYECHAARWSRHLRGVEATIVHGFDECPAEVKAVASAFADTISALGPVESEAAGSLNYKLRSASDMRAMIDDVLFAILDRYRIGPLP